MICQTWLLCLSLICALQIITVESYGSEEELELQSWLDRLGTGARVADFESSDRALEGLKALYRALGDNGGAQDAYKLSPVSKQPVQEPLHWLQSKRGHHRRKISVATTAGAVAGDGEGIPSCWLNLRARLNDARRLELMRLEKQLDEPEGYYGPSGERDVSLGYHRPCAWCGPLAEREPQRARSASSLSSSMTTTAEGTNSHIFS